MAALALDRKISTYFQVLLFTDMFLRLNYFHHGENNEQTK